MKKNDTITNRIDNDEGLKAKRRALITTSLFLLLIQVSGAQITEANTFLAKISFESPNGIGIFLVASVVFLLVRYYGYARQYHDGLFELWSSRMLSQKYMHINPFEDEAYGLVVELSPKGVLTNRWEQQDAGEHYSWSYKYSCSFPLRRSIQYTWTDEHMDHSEHKYIFGHIGPIRYFELLYRECCYRTNCFLTYRENLDIHAPYLIGAAGLLSYFFKEQLHLLMSIQ